MTATLTAAPADEPRRAFVSGRITAGRRPGHPAAGVPEGSRRWYPRPSPVHSADGVVTVATKHSHAPNFGRKVDDCLRCTELTEGAEPVSWSTSRRDDDQRRAQEIREHDCRKAGCSIVCTFGDW